MSSLDVFEDISNPLDSVEEIMASQDWAFQRPSSDELSVQVSGKHGEYRMVFIWQEIQSAMQFFCELDLDIPKARYEMAGRALRRVNEKLWLGHFDIPKDAMVPFFRHTSLFRGMNHVSGTDHVADLIEIAFAECERFYAVFHLLASSTYLDDTLMDLALSENGGEA